jgi:hypothetical protein
MYAGLGDFWGDVGGALGPAAAAAAVVAARIQRAARSGQSLSVPAAIAQCAAAGEIDPATAARISSVAGQIASGAGQVQTAATATGNLSSLSLALQGLPAWVLPAGAVALLWLALRRM